jgi:hypothetical protein
MARLTLRDAMRAHTSTRSQRVREHANLRIFRIIRGPYSRAIFNAVSMRLSLADYGHCFRRGYNSESARFSMEIRGREAAISKENPISQSSAVWTIKRPAKSTECSDACSDYS